MLVKGAHIKLHHENDIFQYKLQAESRHDANFVVIRGIAFIAVNWQN